MVLQEVQEDLEVVLVVKILHQAVLEQLLKVLMEELEHQEMVVVAVVEQVQLEVMEQLLIMVELVEMV